MKRKLGLLIAYPPGVLSSSEGLGRITQFIIQGAIKYEAKIVIVCPKWCVIDLENLFKDARINQEKSNIQIISTSKVPPLLIMQSWLVRFSKFKPGSFFDLISKYIWKVQNMSIDPISRMMGSTSWFVYGILLILTIIFFPFILLFIAIFFIFNQSKNSTQSTTERKIKKIITQTGRPLEDYKNNQFAWKIFNAMSHQEYKKLVKLAKKEAYITSWLIPTVFWPELVKKKSNCVVVCPDIVIQDFPVGFEEYYKERMPQLRQDIEDSLYFSKHLITYSEYVKRNQILSRFVIPQSKISVVPHGVIYLNEDLNKLKSFNSLSLVEKNDLCLNLIQQYLRSNCKNEYLKNFDFTGVKFIMYSSQVRPSKNITTLIRAFARLQREKHLPIKLILTGRADKIPYTSKIILELGLERDIICLHNLPTQVMAAFYHLAILAVNPTLSEGGFPFTFSEAYSVGTPSVMSRIPVVEEMVTDPELQEVMLFNPHDIDDMVERITWGLQHREELYEKERQIFEKLESRSWAMVAQEYLDILDCVSNEKPVGV
jgi:glycosyltransferase involved in cell wall biosynthesis